jgi:hypothetical protein
MAKPIPAGRSQSLVAAPPWRSRRAGQAPSPITNPFLQKRVLNRRTQRGEKKRGIHARLSLGLFSCILKSWILRLQSPPWTSSLHKSDPRSCPASVAAITGRLDAPTWRRPASAGQAPCPEISVAPPPRLPLHRARREKQDPPRQTRPHPAEIGPILVITCLWIDDC